MRARRFDGATRIACAGAGSPALHSRCARLVLRAGPGLLNDFGADRSASAAFNKASFMTFVDSDLMQGRRNGHIKLHGAEGFEGMRKAGQLTARALDLLVPMVRPGVTTASLDKFIFEFGRDHDAYPAPLHYRGYRKSICTSINHVVCHGIPDEKPLRDGDILNIDVTLIVDGWHGDASRMYVAGEAPRAKADRSHLRMFGARHRRGEAGRDDRRHRLRHPELCGKRALLGGAR